MAYYTEKNLLALKNRSCNTNYGLELMEKYPEKFNFNHLFMDSFLKINDNYKNATEEFLLYLLNLGQSLPNLWHWTKERKFSIDFILETFNKQTEDKILNCQKLPEGTLRKLLDKITRWDIVAEKLCFSIEFFWEFSDKFNSQKIIEILLRNKKLKWTSSHIVYDNQELELFLRMNNLI